MVVISISITESPIQKIKGIPLNITLIANIPSTEPSLNSSVASGPIDLNPNFPSIILKCFATDGIDTSSTITHFFGPSLIGNNARLPQAQVTNGNPSGPVTNLFPFGGTYLNPSPTYGNVSVDNFMDGYNGAQIPDGYDGTATNTHVNFTNEPIFSYKLVFSETDAEGRRGRGIGNLPAEVRVKNTPAVEDSSNVNDGMFNSKAMVIFQDGTQQPFDPNVGFLNRANFSTVDSSTYRDGANLFSTALEGVPLTGSFLRQHYNPTNNTITYYYYDNVTNRWIISKEPYTHKAGSGELYHMVFPSNRSQGAGFVYKWLPFQRRALI